MLKSMTREELDRLLEVAKQESFMDYLMMLVTFLHGLRVSETLSLTKDNIVNGYIVVKRGKGSHKCEHPLLLTPSEAEHLSSIEGKFFTMSRITFWRRMQKYGATAGLAPYLRHPHTLKHTCGRLGFKGGMTVPDLVEWLGHKNPAMALVYSASDIDTASRAFAAAVGR
jgi:integrase